MSARNVMDNNNKRIYETIKQAEKDLLGLASYAADTVKVAVCPTAGAKSNLCGRKTAELSLEEYLIKNKDVFEMTRATNRAAQNATDTTSSRLFDTGSVCMDSTSSSSTVTTTCASNSSQIQSLTATATVSPMFDSTGMSLDFTVSLDTSAGRRTIPISIKCSNFEPKSINFDGIEKKIV